MKIADIKAVAEKRNMNFTKSLSDDSMLHLLDENCNYVEQVKLAKGVLDFNGIKYRTLESVDTLIDEMIKAGNAKQYCAAYYNPDLRPYWRLQLAVDSYAKQCGFVKGHTSGYGSQNTTAYMLKNMYGEVVTRIDVQMNDIDSTEGCVVRSIGEFSWCETQFKNVDECIAQFNAMAAPELLANAAFAVKTIEKMNSARDFDAIVIKKFSKETYDVMTSTNNEYKAKLKKMLKDALASLS